MCLKLRNSRKTNLAHTIKFKLKLVLKNHALLNIVEGVEQKPTAIVLLADNSNNAAVIIRNNEIADWDKTTQQGCTKLYCCYSEREGNENYF